MNKKKMLPSIAFSLFLLVCPLLISQARAAETKITPSVGLRVEYDDNIDFDHNDTKRDDFITTVSPGLRLDYKTERTVLGLSAKVNVINYLDYTDENTVDQSYGINVYHQLLEKLGIRANAGYVRDTTQNTYLDETGLVTRKSTVHSYSGGAGLSYKLTEVSDLDLNYGHSTRDYTDEYHEDYTSDSLSLAYRRAFLERRYIVTVAPFYSHYDSDNSTVDNYGLSLGLEHRFWETLTVSASLGARYSEADYHLRNETDSNWNWTANISATRSWETASVGVGYSRDMNYDSNGNPVNVDRFSVSATKKFTEQFGARIGGALFFTKSDNTTYQAAEEDRRYFMISPSLYYDFTKDYRIEAGYTYANDYDKTLQDYQTIDRNRIWILLTFNFPYTW